MPSEKLVHRYRYPALSPYRKKVLLQAVREKIGPVVEDIDTEYCFTIAAAEPLTDAEYVTLGWLLAETFEPENFSAESFLARTPLSGTCRIFEVGPRMTFTTAWSTNAVSICHACGLSKIRRIERSRRYRISGSRNPVIGEGDLPEFLQLIHDRMTECLYPGPLTTFETGVEPEPVIVVPLLEEGKDALVRINRKMGLGLDEWDIDYYYQLFIKDLGRNPTNVECFDLSQSNSEHSRHWFFRGKLVVDGREIPETLMQIVKEPYRRNPNNSIIAFKDNSSAIRGYRIAALLPEGAGSPSPFREKTVDYHIIFTAETHNFPSGVAPFPGAETGTGGRLRDVHATGRGSLFVAGTAAYCVGNLQIPGYPLPWEHGSFLYPGNLASPLQIEIEASNGASDYGNKFGEPLIQGFTRSFGLRLPDGERREWIKPIMFTGGAGQIDARHTEKEEPEKGMAVVKAGGPAYRIGMGGGAASSMIQGENVAELDFNAVQRGDAEMEQKLNRVIRACVELGDGNPIVSIHDQGAGGNCNVVKEIIHPAGARIDIRKVIVGDNTLSVLEIWGAEYQEQDALLIRAEDVDRFRRLCGREKVPVAVIGEITGDGYIVVYDGAVADFGKSVVENLSLDKVLGDMPQKTYYLERVSTCTQSLHLPDDLSVADALDRVLRLVSVGSKRFLTNKVDRSVTGLIARQQCAGPLHLTVSDVAVIAQSYSGMTGAALSIGEQPIKGLINPSAMARMSVGEALTNMVWAKISSLRDIRCSANWMWAPKLPGEGAHLYDAALAMRDIMLELGIAVDGGKDSLSMAARVPLPSGESETVKSPGTLVISAYATCPDITKVVTPDLKAPGKGRLLYIDLGNGKSRMGGSALAQCYKQVGHESPDVESTHLLKDAFNAVQTLVERELVTAGHDRSDGGLATTLLEMAFAGNCGMEVRLTGHEGMIPALFSEELGLVMEYLPEREEEVLEVLREQGVPGVIIGASLSEKRIRIYYNDETVLDEEMVVLRDMWEETSHQLELLQVNPECAREEREVSYDRPGPSFVVPFSPEPTPEIILKRQAKPAVAIVREEGSNGDREMAAAFFHAGFEPWDVTMTDLLHDRIGLSRFKGVVFVGGFSYADVLDSAKGWAGTIRFSKTLSEQFRGFYRRPDTFSLGVCNGCQLAALLGWVPWEGIEDARQPRFIHNKSGRFESRFSTVRILESPAVMLKGMEGAVLGIWVAHGEGQAYFPDGKILDEVLAKGLAPVRYVDDRGKFTGKYPLNPNGSPRGIAALCTPDGRHLAIMPHPERAFLKWQWAWMPGEMKRDLKASPWLRMFQNARVWCEGS
ncbi:MAG: phosphoribosylformylglycinamidine synthase [Alphaproteobacteria bacterium]|uniref:Phosphoribosylformylglycinamidine synthase n=1 Tax=Candidatus Nitrobium versatile TaxID=2884831 RepID=A0A953J6Q6_9BACT|nr:phosphoribosylformylglycinamidine synthase [Candidatus Nitrobium versatile]